MRVALYARVSTEEQALHGLSIDAQIAALDAWAANHTVVDHYVDLGISARKPISKRPELQRLLKDVEQGKIDLVAFSKLDRWTRNIREYYKAQDILDAHGVAWRAIHEDYETQTAAGRLKVNIMLAVAQDEADRTSERIKAVFDDKRRKGNVPTGKVPIGIKIENGKYVPSEDAPKVVKMYDTYINTRSTNETAKRFGVSMQGMRYILTNQNYVNSGVIDEATFQRVQQIRQTRGQRRVRTDRVFLFSGLLECPMCGASLTSMYSNGTKYYRCSRHYDGRCPGFAVNEKKLEKYCLSQLMPTMKAHNATIKNMKTKTLDIGALKAKRDKLADLYMEDMITKEKYTTEYSRLSALITEAENAPRPIDTKEVKTLLQAYEGLSDEAKKAFWSRLLVRIKPSKSGQSYALIYTNGYISEDILTFVEMRSEENK